MIDVYTHDAGVAGADVSVRLHRVPDTEVVCLLLQLGQVEGPGLLPAEVHLIIIRVTRNWRCPRTG